VRVSRARRLHHVDSWLRAVSLFWHLVDAVWIAVFVTIWLIR
jgi:heme/copper-type cytochrome/quinol oxidase subunit 3